MPDDKSLAASLSEMKQEFKDFVQTRVQLLKTETAEKWSVWKRALIWMAVAAVSLITGWFVFVFSLVALVHALLTSVGYGWFWGAIIVSAVFLFLGVVTGATGYGMMKTSGLAPTRTLKVLQQDRAWAQDQMRSA
jgi:uncharacterized membrane protein YqjE